MTASIEGIAGPAPRHVVSWPVAVAALGCMALYVGLATLAGALLPAAAVAGTLVFVIASLRWQLIPLFVFAVVIPFDQLTRLGPLGSPGRIAAVVFVVAYAAPRLWRIRLDAIPAAGWAYLGWAIVSLGWALDQLTTVGQLGPLVQLFALGLLVANAVIERPAIVRPLLAVYSASVALTAVAGIVTGLLAGSGQVQRLAAFEGQDPAQFAAFLLPAFFFGLFELVERRHRLLAAAVSAVCLAGIVLSGSRGAWVSLAAVTALFILPRLRPRQRVAAIGVIAVTLVALLQVPGVAGFVTTRTDLAFTTGGAGRTDIWSVGVEIFESSPITGVGFANFPVAFTANRIQAAGVVYAIDVNSGPHDIVVSSLAELGIVGLALLALFIVPLLLQRGRGPDAMTVQAALAALMIDALFLDVLSNSPQVWVLIGLQGGLVWLARRDRVPGARGRVPTELPADEAASVPRGRAPVFVLSPGSGEMRLP